MISKSIKISLFHLLILLFIGCAPYITSYKHVFFEENERVKVYDRSTNYHDSQEQPLYFAKTDLPVKTIVKHDNYTIFIDTPVNSLPVVFLKITGKNSKELILKGPHLIATAKNSNGYKEGYKYSFLINDSRGKPLKLSVQDLKGKILDSETSQYKIKSRGTTMGIEYL